MDMTFYYKPQKKSRYYLFLTDSNLNLLDSMSVPVGTSYPKLTARELSVNACGQSLVLNGRNYGLVNNTSTVVTATVQNASDSFFDGLFRFNLGVSSNGSEDSLITTSKTMQVAFKAQESKEISFVLSDLKPGYHYSVSLANSAFALGIPAPITFQKDSIVYFQPRLPDLQVDSVSDNWLKVSGNWNDALFSSLLANYPNATSIDLTEVKALNSQPIAQNPNCLFYVDRNVTFKGFNLIRGDTCDLLKLYKGFNFKPISDFQARIAEFYPKSTSNVWSTICLPFNCPVPSGYLVRELSKHTAASLTFTPTKTILAGTPCLFMSDAPKNDCLTSQDVRVSIQAVNQRDSAFVGIYSSMIPGSATRVLNAETLQYFATPDGVTTLIPFSAYIKLVSVITKICPTNFTTDPQYLILGQALEAAWKTLEENLTKGLKEYASSYYDAIMVAENFFNAQNASMESEVAAVTKTLQDAGKDFLRSIGEQVDYTTWLVNPSFELKSTKGWTADNILYPSVKAMTALDFYTSGYDGGYILHVMGKDSIGTNMYQKVNNIPNGRYKVKALLATDNGHSVQLFANNNAVDVAASAFGSYYFNEGTIDAYVTDGTITLGVRANGRWYKADNFRLYYISSDTTGATPTRTLPMAPEGPVIKGGKGMILIESDRPCRIVVYSISGCMLQQMEIQEGKTCLEKLIPGIYLINRKKVVVL